MKIKTSELIGPALDWAVAKCEGYDCQFDDELSGPWLVPQDGYLHDEKPLSNFVPSTDWAQGGPIIDREGISFIRVFGDLGEAKIYYVAFRSDSSWQYGYGPDHEQDEERSLQIYKADGVYGPTPLIAAMRCLVTSKLGNEIEIPEELCSPSS